MINTSLRKVNNPRCVRMTRASHVPSSLQHSPIFVVNVIGYLTLVDPADEQYQPLQHFMPTILTSQPLIIFMFVITCHTLVLPQASSVYNVTGFSIIVGLSAGMETLCGQVSDTLGRQHITVGGLFLQYCTG